MPRELIHVSILQAASAGRPATHAEDKDYPSAYSAVLDLLGLMTMSQLHSLRMHVIPRMMRERARDVAPADGVEEPLVVHGGEG